MKKNLLYGWESLRLSLNANGFAALLLLFCTIYENTLFPFAQVFLLARLLDKVASGNLLTLSGLMWIISAYLLASIAKILFGSYKDAQQSFQQIKTDSYMDLIILKKLTSLDPATFEKPEFQALLVQIDGVSGTLQAHLDRFTMFIDAIVKFTFATIFLSTIFPYFAPMLLAASIPSFIAWNLFRKNTWPFYVEKRTLLMRVTSYIKTLLSSDSTSKEAAIFETGEILLNKVRGLQKTYYQDFRAAVNPMMIGLISGRLLQFSVFIYTQYLTISGVLRGALGIGQFTLVFQQTMNLASSAEAILSQYSSMSIRIKYIDKFFEFMNMKPLITTNTKDITTIPNEPTPTQIEFVDVSFRYPGTEINILHNFNMKINSGEKIALVGENGAGKSTIIKLILRFYDVTEGKILLNGTDIKNVDLGKWRTSVGALFQDFIKYQFTFKENIVLGNTRNQNNKDLMNEVVEKAGIEECLQNLPNGYQQVVGKMFDGGMDLSGGQWQKLALARAFYRDAPILILDEPTSAIDAKAEYEIFERVQKLQDNKTVIIISHRFSTVRNADRILVLNGGKIIEEGDHQQLLAKDGVYAELFNLQAKGYK